MQVLAMYCKDHNYEHTSLMHRRNDTNIRIINSFDRKINVGVLH